jgi:hypothetical protein
MGQGQNMDKDKAQRDDAAYFARREETERRVAVSCDDPAIARAHLAMADAYALRLKGLVTILNVIVDD